MKNEKSLTLRATSAISSWFKKSYATVILPWEDYAWSNRSDIYYSEGYEKNSAVYFAVHKVAEKCSEIPLKLYRLQNGEKVEVPDHELLKLLYAPNDYQRTYAEFVQAWVSYFKLVGDAYLYTPDEFGRGRFPKQLIIMPPDFVQGDYDRFGIPKEYRLTFHDGSKVRVPMELGRPSPLSHTRLFSPRQMGTGLSPLASLRYSIQLLNSTNQYAVNFVSNNCSPPGLLSTEQNLTEEQRKQLDRLLTEKYAGPNRAGRPMVLWGGLKWQSLSGDSKSQVALYEGQASKERDISRTLGVPPILLGLPGDSTFNNIQEAKREFVLSTCAPIMKQLAASLSNWLLVGGREENLFLEPDISGLPEIAEWQAKSLSDLNEVNYITLNEKRLLAGYETLEGDVYDDVFVDVGKVLAQDYNSDPLADLPSDEDSDILNPVEDEGKAPDEVLEFKMGSEPPIRFIRTKTINLKTLEQKARFRRQVQRIKKQLFKKLTTDMKRYFNAQSRAVQGLMESESEISTLPQKLSAVVDSTDQQKRLENILSKHYRRSFRVMDKFLRSGLKKSFSESVQKKQAGMLEMFILEFIRDHTAEHVTRVTNTTKNRIRKAVEVSATDGKSLEELTKDIEKTFKGFSNKRAGAIARTETTMASGEGGRKAFKALDVPNPRKVWLSDQRDTRRPYHFSMNETQIGLDENYKVGNADGGVDVMTGPGDPSAPAGQLVNCICVEGYDADIED